MSEPPNTRPGGSDGPHAEIDQALARLDYYALDRSWRAPAPDSLARLQVEAACTLATDYAAGFLSRYGPGGFGGGGFVDLPKACPIGARFNVDILYGVGSRDSWNPFYLAAETYQSHLPAFYFPIATDPGGNLLVCACGSGAVFGWDHEHRELRPADLDRIAAEAAAVGLDPSRYDLGQLITFWETRNPTAIRNPTGHGNLYPVAGSFTELLANTTRS
jgi:hypothetical protein